jgi:hypothetical protein
VNPPSGLSPAAVGTSSAEPLPHALIMVRGTGPHSA